MKNCLFLVLLLLPALAQAYGGGGTTSAGKEFLFAVIILAPFVLPPLLLLWACLRPQNKGLQLVHSLAIIGLIGLWDWLGQDRSVRAMEGVTFYFESFIPLALLLNGLAQARQAQRPPAQLVWTGIAVTGGSFLPWGLLSLLQFMPFSGPGLLTYLPLTLGIWLGALRWLRQVPALSATLWQSPWWRAPAVAAGITAAFLLANMLLVEVLWSFKGILMLYVAAVTLATGLVALRLVAPLGAVSGEPDAEPAPLEG